MLLASERLVYATSVYFTATPRKLMQYHPAGESHHGQTPETTDARSQRAGVLRLFVLIDVYKEGCRGSQGICLG